MIILFYKLYILSLGVFPTATFNVGGKVITVLHVDSMNLSYGFIAVTSLGNFDPQKGGHIILETLSLVIEFPPGSTIVFPSSIIRHGNVSIAEYESRYSFTQFIPGGLFRYVDYDFSLKKELEVKDKNSYTKKREEEKGNWAKGVELFSLYNNLTEDRKILYK